MAPIDPELDGMFEEWAGRFQAFSRLFDRFSTAEGVRELFDSRISADPEAFDKILEGFDLPVLDKCFWASDVIDRVVSTPLGISEECWLREDLTPKETLTYIRICIRFGVNKPQPIPTGTLLATVYSGRTIIPPGPFLDELKANGLVACDFRQKYDSSIVQGWGPPRRVCL